MRGHEPLLPPSLDELELLVVVAEDLLEVVELVVGVEAVVGVVAVVALLELEAELELDDGVVVVELDPVVAL